MAVSAHCLRYRCQSAVRAALRGVADAAGLGVRFRHAAAAAGGAAVGAVLGAALVTGKKIGDKGDEKGDETKQDPSKGE